MKLLHLIMLIVSLLALAMCVTLSACLKQDAGVTVTYAPSPSAASKIGDEVTFGSYPQAGSNKEPLTWIVLDVDDTKHAMLLLSKYVIDAQQYHTKDEPITWENCTLRAWLNNDFMNTAFTMNEQNRILTTHLTNPVNAEYHKKDVESGNDTDNKVFLLSVEDVGNEYTKGIYFTSRDERIALATAYALEQDIHAIPSCPAADNASSKTARAVMSLGCECKHLQCPTEWWLRSPGSYSNDIAALVLDNGDIGSGYPVNHGGKDTQGTGVRPALWVQY